MNPTYAIRVSPLHGFGLPGEAEAQAYTYNAGGFRIEFMQGTRADCAMMAAVLGDLPRWAIALAVADDWREVFAQPDGCDSPGWRDLTEDSR